jgi:hypothetical protein
MKRILEIFNIIWGGNDSAEVYPALPASRIRAPVSILGLDPNATRSPTGLDDNATGRRGVAALLQLSTRHRPHRSRAKS